MPTKEKVLTSSLTIVGLGFAIFLAITSLSWPLVIDQEVFAWLGGVVLDGGAPYKDAWDIKGPLSFYTYAFSMWIFGRHEYSIRILDLIAVAGSSWALRKLVLRLNGGERFGANMAVLFFVLVYYGWWLGNAAEPDGWGGMLVLLAMVLLLDDSRRSPYWVMAASGAAIATAILLKPTFIVFACIPLLYPPSGPISERRWILLRVIFSLTVISIILVSLLILWASGALPDYLDVVTFIFSSHILNGHKYGQVTLTSLIELHLLLPLMLAVVGLFVIRRNGARREFAVVVTWLGLSVLTVFAQGWGFSYHWFPAVIVVAGAFGCCLSLLKSEWQRHPTVSFNGALLILVWLSIVGPLLPDAIVNSYEWPEYVSGSLTRQQFMTNLTAPWNYWVLERLSDFVAKHSAPGDRVLVWGWDPLVNVLSGRRSPTRFGYTYPLVAKSPLQQKYRQIFIQDISRHVPRYIIVDAKGTWPQLSHSGAEYIHEFPEFEKFIRHRYQLVWTADNFEVWGSTAAR